MEFAIQSTLTAREIKKVREDLGLRQKDFAALANVSVKTVERWESGKVLLAESQVFPHFFDLTSC